MLRATVIALVICCRYGWALNPSLDIIQYAHKSWTIRDGFFKGAITSIAQPPDGYLWIGTSSGLERFDGVRSVPWQPPAGEHLPDNRVSRLLVARDGRLWIGTLHGLTSWKDGNLTHYPEFAGQGVGNLLEDREGTVWFSTYTIRSARLCAIQSGAARCYGEDGRFGTGIAALYEDSKGSLWVGGVAYLWRWRPGPPQLYRMPDPELGIHGLIEGDNGAMLIALRSGIRRLVNGKTEALPLPGVRQIDPKYFLRDRDGGLWIGTDAGLLHIHRGRTDVFTRSDGLSGDYVLSLFEDREGSIWVATYDGGLDRFRDLAAPTISVRQGLSSNATAAILAARDGSVWVGTTDGLNRWKDGKISIYRKGSAGLPDGYVDGVFEDSQGRIWVFTLRGDAYFENGRFVPVSGVPSRYVRAVVEDAPGSLWVSHNQGLFHLLEGRAVDRIPWAKLGREGYANSLVADPARGGLWLGFYEGGLTFFKDGEVRASYGTADGLGEGNVGRLQLDRDGTLWAATEGGLSRVKNGRVDTLTVRNGLPCDTVPWMMEDDDHAFWMSTTCGLARIQRSELEAWTSEEKRTVPLTVFDTSDGVISPPFGNRAATATDGKLWFEAPGGVSVVDPRHLPFNSLPPPVHIENIKADGKIYDLSKAVRLPPLVRDVSIDYTALSFVAPEKVHFRYKLEGQDPDWKEAVNDRQVQYSNLAPRKYRFRVVASNNSGVWNETGDSFEFSVDPAYYQTSWFRALCAAAFLGLLWALYQYRLYQLAHEFDVRMEERVNERTRIARELHDTLLQSFHGLLLRFQAVDNMMPPGKAKETLEKAIDHASQAITEGRDAVQQMRSSTVITNDLALAIRSLGEGLAADSSANFQVKVEGGPRELHPIVRDEIYRIAGEALRNAFRHAEAGNVEVEIRYDEQKVRLRVRDDGRGIDPEVLKQGREGHFGLPGMRERAKLMGGTFEVWSEVDEGTEVELIVPGSAAYASARRRSGLSNKNS
ncbi:MAG TPA: two-component regulator propeller domain-containing protein [Bryobacteraceae bacterium]|nr:two-component regulator propeller domain-containing protein [Bryobacteraceae bacterium]